VDFGGKLTAKVVAPALFLATKLDAFKDRGRGDYYASHDIEDVVTVTDGCSSIDEEVTAAPDQVRAFVATWFATMIEHPEFQDAFPGHLSGISG